MTSIKLFWSLAVHRHQKQHSMSCSFGQSGCQKTMAKNENSYAKICQNLKFFDTWELYVWKESLEYVRYKFKKKKYDFCKKIYIFFKIFYFTLWCRNLSSIGLEIASLQNSKFKRVWKTMHFITSIMIINFFQT